jgi:hypothetical protein
MGDLVKFPDAQPWKKTRTIDVTDQWNALVDKNADLEREAAFWRRVAAWSYLVFSVLLCSAAGVIAWLATR